MTPPSPKTPLETFEAAIDEAFDRDCMRIRPVDKHGNHEHDEAKGAIRQAAIAYGEAEVRAALENEHMQLYARGCDDPQVVLTVNHIAARKGAAAEARRAALQNPDAGEVAK